MAGASPDNIIVAHMRSKNSNASFISLVGVLMSLATRPCNSVQLLIHAHLVQRDVCFDESIIEFYVEADNFISVALHTDHNALKPGPFLY